MSKESYIRGFCKFAADHGADPQTLAKFAMKKEAGPRPKERLQMQRIANKPETLRALTNPITGAPPRMDDPSWNPKRVQAISTIAGAVGAPLLIGTASKLPLIGKAHLESIFGPMYGHPGAALLAPAVDGAYGAAGYGAKKLIEGQSFMSRVQRLRDAKDIISGKNVRPALWNTTSVDK